MISITYGVRLVGNAAKSTQFGQWENLTICAQTHSTKENIGNCPYATAKGSPNWMIGIIQQSRIVTLPIHKWSHQINTKKWKIKKHRWGPQLLDVAQFCYNWQRSSATNQRRIWNRLGVMSYRPPIEGHHEETHFAHPVYIEATYEWQGKKSPKGSNLCCRSFFFKNLWVSFCNETNFIFTWCWLFT